MKKSNITFRFLDSLHEAEVEYFEPPGVMPYYKVNITDPELQNQFGMVHNFKEVIQNGWIVLQPALEPQGKFHAYFWTCLMVSIYILLLDQS